MKFVTVAALVGGVIAAPLVAAGGASAQPQSWCDGVACVPGVAHTAVQGEHCISATRYVFGLGPAQDDTLICSLVGKWVPTKPLIGVRPLGAPCTPNDVSTVSAQSPDGLPMSCNGTGFIADYNKIYYGPST
jgi:hypothetical protein